MVLNISNIREFDVSVSMATFCLKKNQSLIVFSLNEGYWYLMKLKYLCFFNKIMFAVLD